MRCKNIIMAFTVIAIAGMASSCSKQGKDADPNVLLPEITLGNYVEAKTPLSEIIGDYRLIPLETTDESLIGGRTNKIIKKDGHIFVRSNNEVLMFSESGNFQDKLSRVGGGPEEYESIFDYDIVPEYEEIWVSSNRGIVRYKYPSMEFSGIIPLKFFANSFKYLDNDTFIAYTPEDIVYKVVSMDGK
ncbi:MAG: 6-bladed beta-propeller, partial [Muribaculaceae bacterium]|nr:6-bladed beta-propeller [Muribaculaceae bacterium]